MNISNKTCCEIDVASKIYCTNRTFQGKIAYPVNARQGPPKTGRLALRDTSDFVANPCGSRALLPDVDKFHVVTDIAMLVALAQVLLRADYSGQKARVKFAIGLHEHV